MRYQIKIHINSFFLFISHGVIGRFSNYLSRGKPVAYLQAWVEFNKEITPTEGGTAHARAARPAGLSSPDFKFQTLDTAWIPNYIIRTFILAKFGYKFRDGTCALPITKN